MPDEHPRSDTPEQNPFESPEKVSPLKPIPQPTVWAMVGIAAAVLASSAIAFCCTCIPAGYVTFGIFYPTYPEGVFGYFVIAAPWVLGAIVAIPIAIRVRRSLWNRWKQ